MRRIFIFLLFAILSAGAAFSENSSRLNELLNELDKQLELRSTYEQNRIQRINALKSVVTNPNLAPEQRYSFYVQLIDEYKAYNFDSTMHYIMASATLAEQLQNKLFIDEAAIRRGLIFATSGNFLEANNILYSDIDSATLDPSLQTAYYSALQRLSGEVAEYSQEPNIRQSARQKWAEYRAKLLTLFSSGSDEYLFYELEEALSHSRLEQADSLSLMLVSRQALSSHKYAIYAYQRSLVFQNSNQQTGQMEWLARSAIADMQAAVKDHASLCRLATVLFETGGNIERAFRYIDISMADALFYNAKLRPWQIAGVLPQIEKAYQQKQDMQARRVKLFLIVISALSLFLVIATAYLIKQTQRTTRAQKSLRAINKRIVSQNNELEKVNLQLKTLNKKIAESNRVKEEYIGLFLGILSDNLNKMRDFRTLVRKKIRYGEVSELNEELNNSEWMEKEVANFYQMFDTTFLQLYPNFVRDFNALLVSDEQIELKKGELLNTELRIFALIRLGIKDSSKIASLLRYSVNTIYNYRAKIKNCAKGSREDFEERVSTL